MPEKGSGSMKTYRVLFWYTVYGRTQVQAESKEQARRNLQHQLETEGLDGLDYEANDRDLGVADAFRAD